MKPRGARKKMALDNNEGVTPPSEDLEPHSLITASPQHPKHSHSDSDADAEGPTSNLCQPPAKRTKANTTSPVENSHNVASRPRPRPRPRIIPRRSPLPQRINRVINPGAPDQKRAQRTSEEVAAAAKQKEKLALELEEVEKAKVRMVAEMEAADEEEERLEERMAIRHITDLAEFEANTNAASGDDDATMLIEDKDEPRGPAKMVRSILMQKRPRFTFYFIRGGKLLGAGGIFVQQLTGRRRNLGRRTAQNPSQGKLLASRRCYQIFSRFVDNSSSKTLRGTTATKPAEKALLGLVPDWRAKSSKTKVSHSTLEFERFSSPLGGLVDDDAHANFEQPSAISMEHKSRKNEVRYLFYACKNNC